ncbi:MAG: hypothetical protein Q8O88_03895 [bacterium]|nr:hypothetical protein [bacterium]
MTQNEKEAKRKKEIEQTYKKDFPEMFDRYAKALGEIAEQIASAKAYREMKRPSVEEFLKQKQT